MLENDYRSLNDQITAPPEVIAKTLAAANTPKRKPRRRARPVIMAAALLLCCLTVTPVLAANVPAIYELIAWISPELAQHFMPVQRSCEDEGIRLEVVFAYIHGDTAEVYFTLQDLTGGRLDEHTHIDSFNISNGRDDSTLGTCPLVGYDPQTQTATFLATLINYNDQLFSGSKVTFTLNSFTSGETAIENQPIDLALSALDEPTMQEVRCVGGSIRAASDFEIPKDMVSVMVPGEALFQPLDMLWISGAGYIDDSLHIQVAAKDHLLYDGHCFLELIDDQGNHLDEDHSVSFLEEWGNPESIFYDEWVFMIPQSEIGKYKLYGNFYADNARIDGSWQVTFTLEDAPVE